LGQPLDSPSWVARKPYQRDYSERPDAALLRNIFTASNHAMLSGPASRQMAMSPNTACWGGLAASVSGGDTT
jgi:hypothetical protein